MAALRFQIHVDKENASSLGVNPKLRNGSTSGIRGKVFQESITPGLTKPRKALGDVNTPASSRPRKALGDVNGTSGGILKPVKGKSGGLKPLSLNPQSFKKPEGKRSQEKGLRKQEPKISVPVLQTARSCQPASSLCEDIEQMHVEKEPDDDEDVWPARERISTYIDKLISWRPPCLYNTWSDSDDEEDDRKIQEMMGQLDALPTPKIAAVEDTIVHVESLTVPLPEVDVPFADISLLDSSQNTSLPSLEDSYSIVPNPGTLQLKDI
ncbi:uncharacterized protein LOC124111725 [Haliotis rufescens]|uniref:uncharacterized protein LOC124111725 n=1 Tax=Haliotis rufescens TaxID=6454 RepID=UPI001EB00E1E|nr:uncharacterized protein LOC124111725 [Haliotis rufescens]XP_046327462.1 uncharacterized protein LOC124111725 [Haliotis rufescens]